MLDTMPTIQIPEWSRDALERYPDYPAAFFRGGRGRGASQSIARIVLLAMLKHGHNVIVGRQSQVSLEDSNLGLMKTAIRECGLIKYFDVDRRMDIMCRRNGARAVFRGIRNRVNSWRSLDGYQVVWLEEPDEITSEEFDVILPSLRSTPTPTLFASWNPYLPDSPVETLLDLYPGAIVETRTYRDNPFFPQNLKVLRAQQERIMPPEKYRHIWEGEFRPQSEFAYFRHELVNSVYDTDETPEGKIIAGVDVAGSERGDYSAIVALDENGVEALSVNRRIADLRKRVTWMDRELREIGCRDITIDCTGGRGQAEAEALRDLGYQVEEFLFTRSTKPRVLNQVAMSLADRQIALRGEKLRAELLDLGDTGEAMTGHDDLVMALAMAVDKLTGPGVYVYRTP